MKYIIRIYLILSIVVLYNVFSKINYDFMNIKYVKENMIIDKMFPSKDTTQVNDTLIILSTSTIISESEYNWPQMIIDENQDNMIFLGFVSGYIFLGICLNIVLIYKTRKKKKEDNS